MMRRAALLLCLVLSGPARAEEPVRIGVAAPLSGTNASLGRQLAAGARHAAARGAAETIEADTLCSAEGGRAAAERFVAQKAEIAIGFLCTEALEAALPVLSKAGIPTIDVGVRADRFTADRRRTGDLVWRLAPKADAEAQALEGLVAERWRDAPFGILDDGSPSARGLSDAVRSRLEAANLKPSAIDTYRPAEEKQFGLVRRLARTGITRFVLAGERADAATIARDAASSGLSLDIIGGEQLLDEPADAAEVPVGTLAVGPRGRFPRIAALEAAPADRQGYFGPALAAAEIGRAAVALARERGVPVSGILAETSFRTSLGPVRFDAAGDSDLDLFRVFRFDGRDFVPEAGE